MSTWKEYSLKEFLDFGNGKKRPEPPGRFPIYGGNGILGFSNQFNYDDETIIIGRVGAYCGAVFFESGKIWISDNALSAKPKNGYIARYLYYLLKHLNLNQFAEGSSHPLITQKLLNSINVIATNDRVEQKAIEGVLSCLDSKIDLLHRQNKTLEAIAETLFRQWFIEEAEDDWEKVNLQEVSEKITDGAHQSPPTVEDGLPMASVKDMHNWGINTNSCRKISVNEYQKLVRDDCRPLQNDILIAKDGSYLKHIFYVKENLDIVILSSIALIRPNWKYHPILLTIYLKLQTTKDELENIVTGAVIPRIVLKDFRKFPIPLPPKKVQTDALKYIQPLIDKCYENISQIEVLEQQRRILLPKLMSGEVRVDVK